MIYDVEFNSSTQYPAPAVVELAELAEAHGFAAFWEGEANNMDPMVLLSAIAAYAALERARLRSLRRA